MTAGPRCRGAVFAIEWCAMVGLGWLGELGKVRREDRAGLPRHLKEGEELLGLMLVRTRYGIWLRWMDREG